ncbi:hypothetical protein M4951_14130 [Blastopirellula sp. J2-11]|uniref:hypothetical protein n=1 Tax=Blastopirellula sp. J2-11 TaxID=2943192 RepID=UPI0021C875F4|nr:hypothetical protein [Blastopirellula sp. J2-11]UUO04529.1 hypothetical protein M4951_14130 [Blastopirellula sp. J2-11]
MADVVFVLGFRLGDGGLMGALGVDGRFAVSFGKGFAGSTERFVGVCEGGAVGGRIAVVGEATVGLFNGDAMVAERLGFGNLVDGDGIGQLRSVRLVAAGDLVFGLFQTRSGEQVVGEDRRFAKAGIGIAGDGGDRRVGDVGADVAAYLALDWALVFASKVVFCLSYPRSASNAPA